MIMSICPSHLMIHFRLPCILQQSLEFANHLIPNVESLINAMWDKALKWVDIIKIGRTHLQDATPLTVGQEWSGYVTQLKDALDIVKMSMNGLYKLAAGGTAVGTGLNAPAGFGDKIASEIARLTGHPFVSAPNKFAAQASLDPMVNASAALRSLAVSTYEGSKRHSVVRIRSSCWLT